MKKIIFIVPITAMSLLFSCKGNSTTKFCYKIGDGQQFKVLNLADVQLDYAGQLGVDITIKPTINKMINKLKPSIITLSGDYGWKAEGMEKEEIIQCVNEICDCLESYDIDYYFVYGNHDREKATDVELAEAINSHKHGHIERGIELEDSYGNYTIEIQNQNGQPIHAIYMMDSRDYFPEDQKVDETKVEFRKGDEIIENVKYNHLIHGDETSPCIVNDTRYDYIHEEQAKWYEGEVERLNKCESTIITHMPINGFTYAFEHYTDAKNKGDEERIKSYKPIGPCRQEETCSGGVYDRAIYKSIKKYGSTKNVIAGHDHINDFSLLYNGVRFTYAVKTGDGCYWESDGSMNGATLLTIDDKGVGKVSQHYWNPNTNIENDYYEPIL